VAPGPTPKLREIELLRAAAVLMVLLHHSDLRKLAPDILKETWSGVDLFFVISGFVVTLSLRRLLPDLSGSPSLLTALAAARDSLHVFYARRFFRILPAAAAVILLTRALAWVSPEFGTSDELMRESVAFFGGMYNYTFSSHLHEARLGQYWSLSVEEHFYLLLPLLFLAFRTTQSRLAACVACGFASIVARGWPGPRTTDVFYQRFASHLRFDSLLAGVVLALVAGHLGPASSAPRIMPRGLMRGFLLPGCLALVAVLPATLPDAVLAIEAPIALWFLSAVLVAYAALDEGYVALPGMTRVLEYVGSRSYALYLVHVTMFRVTHVLAQLWPAYRGLMGRGADWKHGLAQLALALAGAEILHRAVETPFLRLGRVATDPARQATFPVPRTAKVLAAVVAALLAPVVLRRPLVAALGPRNIALHKPVTMSSHVGGKPDAIVNGALDGTAGARTEDENDPWIKLDLGRERHIGAIRVYAWGGPMRVSVSTDGEAFQQIAERATDVTEDLPWRIRPGPQLARYVRLQIPRKTSLTVSEVEVFEGETMALIPF
jgi:peptidoglycan/LPS O-acetylase OafA/YrhL